MNSWKDWFELLPEGWQNTFVPDLIEDLESITDENFEILDCKEKWNELRIYHNSDNPIIDNIIDKYTTISSHTCMSCGKQIENSGLCENCRNNLWN